MKLIKTGFSIIAILFFGSMAKSQYTAYPMVSTGYYYQSQNFGELGGKVLFIKKDELAFRVGASALMGATHGKFTIIPKIQGDVLFNFRENIDVHQGFYYLVGAESTLHNFTPHIGISVLGVVDFTTGYGFSYHNHIYNKELKGVKFGVTFNVPLVLFDQNKKS